MTGYVVVVKFYPAAESPEQARHAIEEAIRRHLPGGYGYDVDDTYIDPDNEEEE